ERLADEVEERRRRASVGKHGEDVLDVDHPDDLVERFAVDREAAVPRLCEERDNILKRRAFLDRDDVGPRDGDVVDRLFAEMKEVTEHLALDRRKVADNAAAAALGPFFLGLVDDVFDLLA